MATKESIKAANSYVNQGRDAKWLWKHLVKEVLEAESIDVGDRMGQVCDYCSKILKGCYSTREKAWTAAWGNDNADRIPELEHCVELIKFETDWTLKNRPAPPPKPVKPPKEKAEKKEKEAPPKPEVDAAAAPPPPPAPPAPPTA